MEVSETVDKRERNGFVARMQKAEIARLMSYLGSRPKTMSKAAIEQRKKAAKKPRPGRKKKNSVALESSVDAGSETIAK